MTCQSCKKHKNNLVSTKSRLISNITLVLCADCKSSGFEPRHIIVLAARSGVDTKQYIVKRLYIGEEISALEILV